MLEILEMELVDMAKIEKKAWPDLFEAVLNGKKKFDVRLGDFKCNVGDVLILREWDPIKKEYTGRSTEKEIIYVLKTKDMKFWSKEEMNNLGLQILSLG